MSRVFQTQTNPRLDTTDALRFGEIRIVVDRLGEPSVAPRSLKHDVQRKLADFGPDDYLLPIGSPAVIAIVGAVAQRRANGTVNMLLWDRQNRRYEPTSIYIGDIV